MCVQFQDICVVLLLLLLLLDGASFSCLSWVLLAHCYPALASRSQSQPRIYF
jgi:hypothetical protein